MYGAFDATLAAIGAVARHWAGKISEVGPDCMSVDDMEPVPAGYFWDHRFLLRKQLTALARLPVRRLLRHVYNRVQRHRIWC